MRNKGLIFLSAAALLAAAGCSDPTGPDKDQMVGTWNATEAQFVSVANPGTSVDIITQGGTLSLVLSASTFTMTIKETGKADWVGTGTWSTSIDTMTLTWSSGLAGESQFDFTLNGTRLTLEGGHMPHEFTPGNSEESIVSLILVKQ
jgi:Lipocalin-like domain